MAAGKPTLEQVVRGTSERMRGARGVGARPGVSAQRISDWRTGRNVPHTFDAVAPVLVTLFGLVKGQRKSVRGDLVDRRAWERLWAAAVAEAPGEAARPVATMALPRDVDTLVGRTQQLDRIVRAAESGRVVSIHAIDGMPGVGKTALAIRAAHEMAARFPDGQYFVPLHAHTPGQSVADPSEVLAGLLTDLGMDPRILPDTLEGRRDLWRDRLADKRVLLVLDDAAGPEQIEPLLPTGAECVTLVTSRRRLVALDGAAPLALDVLDPDSAATLFAALSHRDDIGAADRAAVDHLVALCGHLPLAIVLLAGQLAHHPAWSVADLAAMFTAATDRLAELETSDRAVRAAFELSYRDLSIQQQIVFGLLGLHPGSEFDLWAVAALADLPLDTARRHLTALYTDHLIDEIGPGRYRLHDLLREFARTLAAVASAEDNARAANRLLDYYRHTAANADRWLARHTRPVDHTARIETKSGVATQDFDDQMRALTWLRTERANLLACLEYAVDHAPEGAAASTAVLAGLLERDGPWPLAAHLHRRAAEIASRLGDQLGKANALNDLGHVLWIVDDYEQAADWHVQALDLYRGLGNDLGQAHALIHLGVVHRLTGDHERAATLFQQALARYRDLGNRRGEANALGNLGILRGHAGDLEQAIDLLRQALSGYREVTDQHGEAYVVNNLGRMYQRTGDYEQAAEFHEQALDRYRDIGNRLGEANALNNLGYVRRDTGDYGHATELFQQSLRIYRELGDRRGEAQALTALGYVHRESGDHDLAAELLRQALALNRALGNRHDEADTLGNLGILHERTGDQQQAADLHRQALAHYRDIGDRLGQAEELNGLGRVLLATGDPDRGLTVFTDALAVAGIGEYPLEQARALDGAARCRAELGDTPAAVTDLSAAVEIYRRLGVPETESAIAYLAALTD